MNSYGKSKLILFLSTGVVVLCALELFSRYYLGVGDPPLWLDDSDIEYIFRPCQEGKQLRNRYHYNAYSMRSEEFSICKVDPQEVRILVFGDSVINGGNLTDQSELATELLKRRLADTLKRPVLVGNISAGSWGPGNYLAYAKKYGLFDADIVVIVLSSHDYKDNPTFKPVAGTEAIFPSKKPVLAICELITRYLQRYLPFAKHPMVKVEKTLDAEAIEHAKQAVVSLIRLSRKIGAEVVIAQHLERQELQKEKPGHAVLAEVAENEGITPVQLGHAFKQALETGRNPYRDNIHPNSLGQELIAECLFPSLSKLLRNTMD